MKYNYPTEEGIKYAIDQGWSEEDARRGFCIFDYDGTGLLEVEVLLDAHVVKTEDGCYYDKPYDDEAAAREAERIGYCKIIPVDELPDFYDFDGNNLKFFGWVDTPENRKRIKEWSEATNTVDSKKKSNHITKERMLEIFSAYVDDDLVCSESGWIREKLMDNLGVTKSEMYELGFDWMLIDEEE